ncbi:MAG TPA: hypothetical protein VE890_12235, partial [Thermoguttaceae bacterium]|nr:hypothetical protein [Thermoguttaceae bacterium]
TFIDGLIAGVTTGGISLPGNHDVIAGIQSSFGDFGVDTRVSLFAGWIDQVTTGSPEFLVNQTIGADQKWSTVALDASGDFVITWTSYGQDVVGEGYGPGFGGEEGIYARRYHAGGFPGGFVTGADNEFQVNSFAQYDQQHSRIAMDADGDFVISWESFQDQSDGSGGPESADSFGIYAQRYAKTERMQQIPLLDNQGAPVLDGQGNPIFVFADPLLGPNGSLGGELAINTTKDGDQRYSGVGIDDTGDFMIVWSGNGEGSPQGVFYQRYDKVLDQAGPTIGDVLNVADTETGTELDRVKEFDILYPEVTQFVISFGENLSTTSGASGTTSVLNWRNWGLTKDGEGLYQGIATIEFGLSKAYGKGLQDSASQKYEAVITFDGNPSEPGLQPLEPGTYELTIRDTIEDLFGNRLDGDFDGSPQGNFRRNFVVYSDTPNGPGVPGEPDPPTDPNPDDDDLPVNGVTAGDQEQPAVASDADGNHVIVWVTRDANGDGDIKAQRFDRFGQPIGNEFQVNNIAYVGDQTDPDVAMDAYGNFVVTWSGAGEEDTSGVFAQVYDPFGVATGAQFRVNQLWQSDQLKPSAAMDQNGDFVISFTNMNQAGDEHAVYARRFNFLGQPLSTEFQVNKSNAEIQTDSDVAMDANGNFVAVWASFNQDGGSWGIFGQRFDANGQKIGNEFGVNRHVDNRQVEPQIAMDLAGNFVVTWASLLQDGDGYGIYARRFNANATPRDSNEFLVNQTTYSWQRMPAVDMDDLGDFVITWSSTGQDNVENVDEGVYARMYNADGSDYLVPSTDLPLGEFRVNATVVGDQTYSAVAVDSDGDYVVAWVGPDHTVAVPDPNNPLPVDPDPTDVYSRVILVNPQSYNDDGSGGYTNPNPSDPTDVQVSGTEGDDLFEIGPGATPGTWSVRLNGVNLNVASSITTVGFDGLGGNDTVKFTGTSGQETAELWPTAGIVRSGVYAASFANVESITVNAAGGDDELTLHDSDGDDTFSVGPGGATMLGDQVNIVTTGFETVLAHA